MAGVKGRTGGRNAKPTQTHVLTGTFRSDRHGAHETPAPPAGRPVPPGALTRDGRAEWDRMVTRLEENGTLSKVDDAALYQYAQLFAETERIAADHERLRRLSAAALKLARELEGSELSEAIKRVVDLELVIARQTTQLRQGHMAIRVYLVEFGMTPSARTRVKLPAGGDEARKSPLDRFLNRKRG